MINSILFPEQSLKVIGIILVEEILAAKMILTEKFKRIA